MTFQYTSMVFAKKGEKSTSKSRQIESVGK